MISSASEEEDETREMWVSNGAYTLSCSDRELLLSQRGWLTDKIICTAQKILLLSFPNMSGLQPPTLQKVFAFQVHSGEFVQIVNVRNNHWCVHGVHSWLSKWCCLYKMLFIASTVHVPS